MELNEPSAELMRIPGVANISAYLRDTSFSRKLFGGCDYDEVLDCFAEVNYRYNSVIESLLPMRVQAMQAFELQDRLEQMNQEYEILNHYCKQLRQWCERQQAENIQLKREAAALQTELIQRGWTGFAGNAPIYM